VLFAKCIEAVWLSYFAAHAQDTILDESKQFGKVAGNRRMRTRMSGGVGRGREKLLLTRLD
jgi:hypothetical protein